MRQATSAEKRCPFCQIVNAATAEHLVFADELTLAFLDRRPLFPGHCLLIPRTHYATLTDLPEELISPLFGNARRLAEAVERAMAAEGTFVAINNRVSQSVPHLHIHIVPRRRGDGLKGFFWPRHPYAGESAMIAVQEAIRKALTEGD